MRAVAFFCTAAFFCSAACTRSSGLPPADLAVAPDLSLPVSGDVALRACLNVASCLGGNVSSCTSGLPLLNAPTFSAQVHQSPSTGACYAEATTCDGVRACLNGGAAPTPCSGNTVSCRSDDVITHCSPGVAGGGSGIISYDCSDTGLKCVTGMNGHVECGLGSCAGLSASCVGTQLQYCILGVLRVLDCDDLGSTCAAQKCVGKGSACSVDGGFDVPVRCDGTRMIFCSNGQEASFDCAAVGRGCFPNIGGKAAGCAAASECDPQTFTDSCMGSSLRICNAGRLETVDCMARGFSSCGSSGPGGISRCAR